MKLETLAELNAERAARRPVIVVTDTGNGEQRLVKAADIAADPLHAELAKQLRMGKSGTIESGGKKLFLNVYAPTARLVIIGAVHISQALAPLARSLDYDVTVVDPRTAFASPERFPDVPLIAEWPDVALPPLHVDHYTAFVAVTHDPAIRRPRAQRQLPYCCRHGSPARPRASRAGALSGDARGPGHSAGVAGDAYVLPGAPVAAVSVAHSRSRKRCTLPVSVRGRSSTNWTRCGYS